MQQDVDKVDSEELLRVLLTRQPRKDCAPQTKKKSHKRGAIKKKKKKKKKSQAEAAHTFNPSTWEAGRAGRSQ